jgi:hypothetical protein
MCSEAYLRNVIFPSELGSFDWFMHVINLSAINVYVITHV